MEDTSNDEAVSQFMAITGSSDATSAKSYLEMSGGDVQTAIGLFLEHSSSSAAAPPSSSSTTAGLGAGVSGMASPEVRAPDRTQRMRLMDDGGMGMGMGMGGGIPYYHPAAAFLNPSQMNGMGGEDEEDLDLMAAAWGSLNPSSGGGNAGNSAVGSLSMGGSGSLPGVGAGNFRDQINQTVARGPSPVVPTNNDGSDDVEDVTGLYVSGTGLSASNAGPVTDAASASVPSVNPHDRANTLSTMFAPPSTLLHTGGGGFMGARNDAKESKRWLLVNLQDEHDFACHALNRDVWRDELVENLIREGFLFIQIMSNSTEGNTYRQRYKAYAYPHVAIIDPRTGRLLWKKEGWTQQNPMTAEEFVQAASDFCSRHSFDREPMAPRIGNQGPSSLQAAAASGAAAAVRTSQEMTEEEQLQAAIQASMNDDIHQQATYDDDDEDSYIMEDDDDDDLEDMGEGDLEESKPAAAANIEEEKEARPPTFEEEIISMEVSDEPGADVKDVARIMLRMPDGKRLVRKFASGDSVKMIYAFVAHSSDEAKGGKEFELKAGFPPKNLLPSVDESIASMGLSGDTITVRWKS